MALDDNTRSLAAAQLSAAWANHALDGVDPSEAKSMIMATYHQFYAQLLVREVDPMSFWDSYVSP